MDFRFSKKARNVLDYAKIVSSLMGVWFIDTFF